MKTISSWDDLKAYGIDPLTAEACGLGYRLLCDLTAEGKKILELNADHPAVAAIQQLHAKEPGDPRLEKYSRLLYDQALIAEGSKVRDPLAFAQRINEVLARDAGK